MEVGQTAALKKERGQITIPERLLRLIGLMVLLVGGLYMVSLSSCTFVPFDEDKQATSALAGDGTQSAAFAAQMVSGEAGNSAAIPLLSGTDGLGARLRMIEAAERSIDLQTFLIKPDLAGTLIWLELYEAAERGVRIRLLYDDVFTEARDDQIATLDAHPNVEIRVFNPLSRNSTRMMNFVLDFARVNRRMHNKAMVVDGSLAIIGGRNIADEYYQIGTNHEFADFDLLLAGEVTEEVSEAFDLYWNDLWAVPLATLETADPAPLQAVAARFQDRSETELFSVYSDAADSRFLRSVLDGAVSIHSGSAQIVADHPDKLRARPGRGNSAATDALHDALAGARNEILIMTPYFVPQEAISNLLVAQAEKGVRVRVITNSLASTNHAYVHGGYSGYRTRLLSAGVEILEVRADAPAVVAGQDTELTMHTKLAIIDGNKVFSGSSNVDPRSFNLNTEIAILVESQSLAESIVARVDSVAADYTFGVQLGQGGKLTWHYDGQSGPEVYESEPLAGRFDKFVARVTSWLPVEGQL